MGVYEKLAKRRLITFGPAYWVLADGSKPGRMENEEGADGWTDVLASINVLLCG